MRMHTRLATLASIAYSLSALAVAACTSSVSGDAPTVPPPTQTVGSVAVTPATASLSVGKTMQLAAVAKDADGSTMSGRTVSWSSSNQAIAAVSANGLVSALAVGTADIAATVDGVAGHALLTAASVPPVLQQVTLTPASVTLAAAGTQQFSVALAWNDGASRAVPVTFSATGGTISAAGLFTAGSAAGTYQVIVREPSSGLADTSSVVVSAAPPPTPVLQQVTLTPASVTLTAGATQQFSSALSWSDGATRSVPVGYTATGGTITSAGLFTAGTATGTFRVIARETTSGLADTSAVVVNTPPPPVGVAEPRPTASSTILFQDDFERYDGTCESLVTVGRWATSDDYCNTPGSSVITTPDATGSLGTATGVGGHSARWNWPISTSEQFYLIEHPVSGFSGRQPEYFSYDYKAPGFVYVGAYPRVGKKMFLLLVGGSQTGRVTINPWEWGLQQSNGVHLNPTFDQWPAGLTSQAAYAAYLTNGQWHRYTIMRLPESSNGAMDGMIRIWVDGYLVVNYTAAGTFTGNTSTIDLAGTFNGGSSILQTEYYDNVIAWR